MPRGLSRRLARNFSAISASSANSVFKAGVERTRAEPSTRKGDFPIERQAVVVEFPGEAVRSGVWFRLGRFNTEIAEDAEITEKKSLPCQRIPKPWQFFWAAARRSVDRSPMPRGLSRRPARNFSAISASSANSAFHAGG
jgi:hypothetical protein